MGRGVASTMATRYQRLCEMESFTTSFSRDSHGYPLPHGLPRQATTKAGARDLGIFQGTTVLRLFATPSSLDSIVASFNSRFVQRKYTLPAKKKKKNPFPAKKKKKKKKKK